MLAHRRQIAAWRDTDLVAGDDWDDAIKERLSRARIILLMVSRDFLASDYIREQERPLAMKLMKEERAIVVPVILSPCDWQDEDFGKLEPLPTKREPVSSFTPRDKAWALVEEGLKKAVEKARDLSRFSDRHLNRTAEF